MSQSIQTPFGRQLGKGEVHKPYDAHLSFSKAPAHIKAANALNCRSPWWSKEEDNILLRAMEEGKTFREASELLKGRSRDSCIGRMQRLYRKLDNGQ